MVPVPVPSPVTQPVDGALSVAEIAGLKFMHEEEKLAHDVYADLYTRWGHGVYSNLLCGSRNHLRAFNGALLAQGVAYVAQVIPQAQWDVIAGGANEACGR